MANIFQCINKERSNVHCNNIRCTYNYENTCIHNTRIEECKNSTYIIYEDCGLSAEEDILDDMYWY